MNDSQIVLKDGRTLAFTHIGPARGPVVVFCHGAPMSRLHLAYLEDQFGARGIRVVSPDRPGYGRSATRPGRSVADWPADVAALTDALGIDRFVIAGHSTGGAYAVVCAARLGNRVLGGVVLAGVTDMSWPDAWTGYLDGRPEIEAMRLADENSAVARCAQHFGEDGRGFLEEPFEWSGPDAAFLGDPTIEHAFSSAVAEAFRQGIIGYAQDVYLEGKGWSFDPACIMAPFEIVRGEADTLVPEAHGRHTAGLIPGSTFRSLPGHGHLTIVSELPGIASALARTAG